MSDFRRARVVELELELKVLRQEIYLDHLLGQRGEEMRWVTALEGLRAAWPSKFGVNSHMTNALSSAQNAVRRTEEQVAHTRESLATFRREQKS